MFKTGDTLNERMSLLALHLSGVVGPRRLKSVRSTFPILGAVFGTTEDLLSNLEDWNPSSARKVLSLTDPLGRVQEELEKAQSQGIRVLVDGDVDFPDVFKDLYDPPFVLWCQGTLLPSDRNSIAVIGCRKPSSYGRSAALKISEDVVRAGYTVVSGLARGIDSLAHIGALKYPGGRTIAFLGSGLSHIYPPENRKLAQEIVDRGCLVSEYPLYSKPLSMHFPQRNRLISGASKGVLVVEAKKDSGSFITVDHALEQGRPVFAIPGPITHEQSEGTHALIQQGAKLVTNVEDIFHELQDLRAETLYKSRPLTETQMATELELTTEEKGLLDKLTFTPAHVDAIVRETQIPSRRLNEILLTLEIKGKVQQTPGHCYFKI